LAPHDNASSTIAIYATSIVAFARVKITNLGMLHLRSGESIPISPNVMNQQEVTMDRIYRALGLAVALGTSGLMFALTLA
jgi:hypothetical protein